MRAPDRRCRACPKAERRPRGDALIERVGLADAADRKVGGYSGGMKRRLDLALALVHRPRILFLDEPTTGLDPSSRADMWKEVSRLARDEGVTVFLTTQYLEEADVLADRIAIIDHGQIVAARHAGGAQGRDRAPDARGHAGRAAATARTVESVLARFGSAAPAAPEAAAVRLRGGAEELAAVVRALDAEDVAMRDFQLHAPDARRRVPGQDRPQARRRRRGGHGRAPRGGAGVSTLAPGRPDGAALDPADAAPARDGDPADRLPAAARVDQRRAASTRRRRSRASPPTPTGTSRSPCRSCRARCSPRSTPARALARDVETGFLKRLAMTPMQRTGAAARAR